jgi:hypothetical protein
MKIIYVLIILVIFYYPLKGQVTISEKQYGSPKENMLAKIEFDSLNYYLMTNENGERNYISQSTIEISDTQNEMVEFTLNLVSETNGFKLVRIYNNERTYVQNVSPGQNSVTINVEPGVYDIFVTFNSDNEPNRNVIKEFVNIAENSTIQINAAEAQNKLTHYIIDENGNRLDDPSILEFGLFYTTISVDNFHNLSFLFGNIFY